MANNVFIKHYIQKDLKLKMNCLNNTLITGSKNSDFLLPLHPC